MQPNMVTVLAHTAICSHDLDEARAMQAKKSAESALQNLSTDMNYANSEAELADSVDQLAAIKKAEQTALNSQASLLRLCCHRHKDHIRVAFMHL